MITSFLRHAQYSESAFFEHRRQMPISVNLTVRFGFNLTDLSDRK
jgi:hypothetical protein